MIEELQKMQSQRQIMEDRFVAEAYETRKV